MGGKTWKVSGVAIAGIHAGVAQLKDDRLMSFGCGNNIDGKMPRSISSDMGETWTYSASTFPPIGGGQRLVLMRLEEGPLFFASLPVAVKHLSTCRSPTPRVKIDWCPGCSPRSRLMKER